MPRTHRAIARSWLAVAAFAAIGAGCGEGGDRSADPAADGGVTDTSANDTSVDDAPVGDAPVKDSSVAEPPCGEGAVARRCLCGGSAS